MLSDSNTVLEDIALLSLFGESTLYTTTRLYLKNSITMLNELISVRVVLPNKGERNSTDMTQCIVLTVVHPIKPTAH